MIQLSDIISRIRTKHEQATNVRWTDANIQGIINEGLESLAESTHFYERYTTIPMAVSRHWYDLQVLCQDWNICCTDALSVGAC